jgi:RNA polymerase sigma factor (sigma-70 family)
MAMAAAAQRTILQHLHSLAVTHEADAATDAELLRRFAERRDHAIFAILLRRHASLVWGVCRRVLRHHQDAEDAFQATFLVLARNVAAMRNGQALQAWLHRAAYRMALITRRAAARRQRYEGKASAVRPTDVVTDLAWREVQSLLEDELQRLPEKYRVAFVLCCLENRGRADAARLLGIKEGTVASRLDQARKQLQSRLARRGVTLSMVLAAMTLVDDAVPAQLCAATARAAAHLAAKASVVGVVGGDVARLIDSGARLMFAGKRHATALWLAACLAMMGAGLVACQPRADNPEHGEGALPVDPAVVAQDGEAAPRVDLHGDALPPEASVRLGTLRFRPGGFIQALAFAPDARTIVAQGTQGFVTVFDAQTGRRMRRFEPGTSRHRPAMSADGRWLVLPVGTGSLPIDTEAALELWDIANGNRVRAFGKAPYAGACWSADGKLLAGLRYDEVVEIWDPQAGKLIRWWKAGNGPGYDLAFVGRFTADGKVLVTSHWKQTVRTWDASSGQRLHEVAGLATSDLFAVSPTGVLAVDGKDPAVVGKPPAEWAIRLIDLKTGKDMGRLAAAFVPPPNGRPNWFISGQFSPDGTLLATTASDNELRLWDVAAGKQIRAWPYLASMPGALSFSADGRQLALADGGTTVRVLDVASGGEASSPPGPRGGYFRARFTPPTPGQSASVVSLGVAEPTLHIWDAATGRLRQRHEWSSEAVNFPVLSADGTLMYSWGSDRKLHTFDVATGKELRSWRDDVNPFFSGIVPAPDGKSLALIYQNPTIVLADSTTGQELRRFEAHTPWAFGAAFSPDGRTLVTWGADAKACVWDVATGQRIREIAYSEMPDPKRPLPPAAVGAGVTIFVAAVSPDARLIAFGSRSRSIAIHELATSREVRRIAGLPQGVQTMAFSPDGRTLVWSGTDDPTVRLLEIATGKERHRLSGHLGAVASLAYSVDGRRLLSGSLDTTALIWDLAPAAAVPDHVTSHWNDLAGPDAARAYRAIRQLAASPAFFAGRLRPRPTADAAVLARLIGDLGSEDFAVRDRANAELDRLGDTALAACRKALAREPALELRRRLEALIDKQARAAWELDTERLQALRALEALELAGSGEACRILQQLATASEGTWLSDQAAAALRRLRP